MFRQSDRFACRVLERAREKAWRTVRNALCGAAASCNRQRATHADELAGYVDTPAAGGWFRRLKKRQPITARRVDEMEVRLPLEESLCPHRSSSSAFSTGVSSFTPCCILPLSRHYPRSASFYFYFHPLCTVSPLPTESPIVSSLSRFSPPHIYSLVVSPSLRVSLLHLARHSRQHREEIHFREKKSPRKIDACRPLAVWPVDRGCIGARRLAGVA